MSGPSKVLDYDPKKLPEDILKALGFIVAASAQTENILEMVLGALLQLENPYSIAVTTHMNAPLLDHAIRSTAQIRIDNLDALDTIDDLLDAVSAAFTKRNDYVHGQIASDPETGQCVLTKIKARGELDAVWIPVTAAQINADAELVLQSGLNLLSFVSMIGFNARFSDQPLYRGHKSKMARKKRRKERLRSASKTSNKL